MPQILAFSFSLAILKFSIYNFFETSNFHANALISSDFASVPAKMASDDRDKAYWYGICRHLRNPADDYYEFCFSVHI